MKDVSKGWGYALTLIKHIIDLAFGDARILHRVRRVLTPDLPLHSGDVAGLLNQVTPHRVTRTMRRSSFDAGDARALFPNLINRNN